MILASFYRHVSLTNDEVTAMLGEVKLQMVRGDIIHETTDAIINTTDFSSNQSGRVDFLNVLFDSEYAFRGRQHVTLVLILRDLHPVCSLRLDSTVTVCSQTPQVYPKPS